MTETLVLELLFQDDSGANTKINVPNPLTDLTPQQAKNAVDAVVDANIFNGKNGDPYAIGKGARYVRRSVEDILEID